MQCIICGAEFLPRVHNQRCCSPECSRVHEKQREQARYKGRHRGKTERHFLDDKVCPICGKTFHPKRESAIYCSWECFSETRQKAVVETQETKVCKWCGKEFKPIYHGAEKYCSDECRRRCHNEAAKQYQAEQRKANKIEKQTARAAARGKAMTNKPKKTIAQIVREARERGMSYGQYMLLTQGGGT